MGTYPTLRPLETNGLLIQETGPSGQHVAPHLKIIVAIALMVKDTDRLTLGQKLRVATPHGIEGLTSD